MGRRDSARRDVKRDGTTRQDTHVFWRLLCERLWAQKQQSLQMHRWLTEAQDSMAQHDGMTWCDLAR